MANLTSITVSSCDNELYIIATTEAGSTELLHLKSGYNQPVNTTVYPGAILAAGDYDIVMLGLDWGGAVAFNGTLSYDDGTTPSFSLTQAAGPVWSLDLGTTSVIAP